MQDQFGYPALTDSIRRKIFGPNAAHVYGVDPSARRCVVEGDFVDSQRTARRDAPSMPRRSGRRHGPINRREFIQFTKWERYFGLG